MNEEKISQKGSGKYARPSVDEAIRNHKKTWNDIQAEEIRRQRFKRVLLILGLVATTAAMVAFIQYEQITYELAMAFNALFAAMFGFFIK